MLIVYVDKSKLSTFGTKKAYPVVARCANLPVELQNGIGLGGGRVVGWLPIVCCHAYCLYLILMMHSRLRKMQQKKESQVMLTSSVLFGTSPFLRCWNQFTNSPKLGSSFNVWMGWSGMSSQSSLCFQQTMKNSMSSCMHYNLI